MHRFAQRPCQANSNHFTHSLLEQIAKLLEPIKKDLQDLKQGQSHHTTALKALGAGHQDLVEEVKTIYKTQKTLATKEDVNTAVEAAKSEIQANINTLT